MTPLKTLFPLIAKAAATLKRSVVSQSSTFNSPSSILLWCYIAGLYPTLSFLASVYWPHSLACNPKLGLHYLTSSLVFSLGTTTQHSTVHGAEPPTPLRLQPRLQLVQEQSSDTFPELVLTIL